MLERSFNRSFTHYFLDGHPAIPSMVMASLDTPKSKGEPLGRVSQVKGTVLQLDSDVKLVNGDGLSYVGQDGVFTGMRVNEVRGRDIVLNAPVSLRRGTMVYRTFDKEMNDVLSRPSAERRINVDMTLRLVNGRLFAEVVDERGNSVCHGTDIQQLEKARTPQNERQCAELSKLGNTIYRLRNAEVLGDYFIPASVLSQLRREIVELLDRAQRVTMTRDRRRIERRDAPAFADRLSSADNVANRLAREFYEDHGVRSIVPAVEVDPGNVDVVMTMRYCIRRELGACRKLTNAKILPEKLYLRSGDILMSVECDCKRCEMRLRKV